jgi:hypothetical protein
VKIDPGDISDFMLDFEAKFERMWKGQWVGAEDPTLAEFAQGLTDSTSE